VSADNLIVERARQGGRCVTLISPALTLGVMGKLSQGFGEAAFSSARAALREFDIA
jgi:hypothetical protein